MGRFCYLRRAASQILFQFPRKVPYRSIDWTCMSKKDEKRLYRSTDWTYESTLAVDKRKIASATGKR